MHNNRFLLWVVVICGVLTAIGLSAAQANKAHEGLVLLCSTGDQNACESLISE